MFYLHTHTTGGMTKGVLWWVDALIPLWTFDTFRSFDLENKLSKIIAQHDRPFSLKGIGYDDLYPVRERNTSEKHELKFVFWSSCPLFEIGVISSIFDI